MIGLVVGAAAVLAWRPRNRRPEPRAEREEPTRLPPGVASVLSVLPSSAVVIAHEDRVLRASSAARAFGLVKGDELVVGELIALARQVRRDGEIRETEVDVVHRKFGGRPRRRPRIRRQSAVSPAGCGRRQRASPSWSAT